MPWCRLAFWLLLCILLLAVWNTIALPLSDSIRYLLRSRSIRPLRALMSSSIDETNPSPCLWFSYSFSSLLFLFLFCSSLQLHTQSFSPLPSFSLSLSLSFSLFIFLSDVQLRCFTRRLTLSTSMEHSCSNNMKQKEKKILCQMHETVYWFPNEQEAITRWTGYFEFWLPDVNPDDGKTKCRPFWDWIFPSNISVFISFLLFYLQNI